MAIPKMTAPLARLINGGVNLRIDVAWPDGTEMTDGQFHVRYRPAGTSGWTRARFNAQGANYPAAAHRTIIVPDHEGGALLVGRAYEVQSRIGAREGSFSWGAWSDITVAPAFAIEGVALEGAAADRRIRPWDRLTVVVKFTVAATLGAGTAPSIDVDVDAATLAAAYRSGSGTTT